MYSLSVCVVCFVYAFFLLLSASRNSQNVFSIFHVIFVFLCFSKELGTHRGGCIMCMDYGVAAAESYVRLVRVFDPIAQILTLQLHLLQYMGFDMSNGYLFGFSYGGQLATEAGRRLGYKRLKEIDSESFYIQGGLPVGCQYFIKILFR